MRTIQMNLRVKESVAEDFKQHCKGLHLTQSDGLQMLLDLRDREEEPIENCYEVDLQQAELLQQEKDLTRVLQQTLDYVLHGEIPPEPVGATGMYQYPKASGSGIISLEDLVRDGTALHVYGIRQDNAARIKLTHLQSDESAFSTHREYATQHSQWFVGYVHRPNGMAEIVSAIPVESLNERRPLAKISDDANSERKTALDVQISRARSGYTV